MSIITPDGRTLAAEEVVDSETVSIGFEAPPVTTLYRLSPAKYGISLVAGGTYQLRIVLPDGRRVSGSTTIPRFGTAPADTPPEPFDIAHDTLSLIWPRIAGAGGYEVTISSKTGTSTRFADTAIVLTGNDIFSNRLAVLHRRRTAGGRQRGRCELLRLLSPKQRLLYGRRTDRPSRWRDRRVRFDRADHESNADRAEHALPDAGLRYSGCGDGRWSARRNDSRISLAPRCRSSLASRTPVSSGWSTSSASSPRTDRSPLTSAMNPWSTRSFPAAHDERADRHLTSALERGEERALGAWCRSSSPDRRAARTLRATRRRRCESESRSRPARPPGATAARRGTR